MSKIDYLGELSTKQLLKVPKYFYFFIFLSLKIEIYPRKVEKVQSTTPPPTIRNMRVRATKNADKEGPKILRRTQNRVLKNKYLFSEMLIYNQFL